MKKTTCIIPGSFDPMTFGHLSIISKAAELFDNVVVAILRNSDKNTFLSVEERKIIAEKTCTELSNVKVIAAEGLLIDVARDYNAKYIVKGVRNTIDFEYEQNMMKINSALAPEIQTIYIPCDPKLEIVSSGLVRELHKNGKPIDAYVHQSAVDIIKK